MRFNFGHIFGSAADLCSIHTLGLTKATNKKWLHVFIVWGPCRTTIDLVRLSGAAANHQNNSNS